MANTRRCLEAEIESEKTRLPHAWGEAAPRGDTNVSTPEGISTPRGDINAKREYQRQEGIPTYQHQRDINAKKEYQRQEGLSASWRALSGKVVKGVMSAPQEEQSAESCKRRAKTTG